MKYRDKVKPRPSKQKSNTDFYEPHFEHTKICTQCGKTFPQYDCRKTCCGVSIDKIRK